MKKSITFRANKMFYEEAISNFTQVMSMLPGDKDMTEEDMVKVTKCLKIVTQIMADISVKNMIRIGRILKNERKKSEW